MPMPSMSEDVYNKRVEHKHGSNFEYLDDFASYTTLRKTKCKKHGTIFNITPLNHIKSDTGGCKLCYKQNMRDVKTGHKPRQILSEVTINRIIEYEKQRSIKVKKKKEEIKLEKIRNNFYEMQVSFEKNEHYVQLDIPGFNVYFITNCGKVFNENYERIYGNNNDFGYNVVSLVYEGKSKSFYVHRLVCHTFNGPQPSEDKYMVDHINRDTQNNCSYNLRWVTPSENTSNRSDTYISEEKQAIYDEYYSLNREDEEIKIIDSVLYGYFPNYAISNCGRVININKRMIVRPYLNNAGYFLITLNNKNIALHRLVCELFVGEPTKTDNVVNHKDFCRNNNYFKNLEFVSAAENTRYTHNKPVDMLDDNGQIIKTFASLKEAALYFNIGNPWSLSNAINEGEKIYGHSWKFSNIIKTTAKK